MRLRYAATTAVLFGLAALPSRSQAAPVLPEFSPGNFIPGAPINNRYFPLVPGTTYHAEANVVDPESGESVREVDEDFVTHATRQIAGVTARVVRARSFEDGVLAEDTRDYYAQDRAGNVWYLGEDTTAFEYDDDGNVVGTSTRGSWRAGVRGAKPGFIMPANPTVGFSHYQEFSPQDEALDQAEVISLTETITVPVGTFSDVLKTMETSEAEPGVREFKYYAPGVGLILTEEDVDAAGVAHARIPLTSVSAAAVPLPAGLPAALSAALPLAAARGALTRVRRRRLA